MEEDKDKPVSDSSSEETPGDAVEETETPVEGEEGTETEDQPKKRSAEARIGELISEIKTLKSELQERHEVVPPPAPVKAEVDPENQKAVDYLKDMGFVHKADLEERDQRIKDRMTLDNEHQKLEGRYTGADGRPTYDRGKIEEYMRANSVYSPEAAYKLMNEEELLDWSMKRLETERKKKPFVQKPGGSSVSREDNTISAEKINEWLKTPEGRVKYENNRKKILDMYAKGQL